MGQKMEKTRLDRAADESAKVLSEHEPFPNAGFYGNTQAIGNNYGNVMQNNINYYGDKRSDEDSGEALFPQVDPQPSCDLAREKARKLELGTRVELLNRLRQACSRNPCSVLLANAGMGKSCVMGALATELYSVLNKDHAHKTESMNVAAIHFFRYADHTQSKVETCVLALAKQLCYSLPGLRKHMPAKAELQQVMNRASSARNKARFLLSDLIIKPCRKLEKPTSRKIMIIDALDECEDSDALTTAIQDLWATRDNNVASHQAPSWLGLLVSTRPQSLAKARLNSFEFMMIEPNKEENMADLRLFIDNRLRVWNVAQSSEVSRILFEKCQGVFLWLEYQEKELKELAESGRLTTDSIRDLPEGLDQIYVDYFSRIKADLQEHSSNLKDVLPENDPRLDNLYQTAVATALLAPRKSLPEAWWRECLGFGQNSRENAIAYAIVKATFSTLLIFDEDSQTIQAPHKSMVDFINYSLRQNDDPSVLDLQVEISPKHHESLGKAFYTACDDLTHSFQFGNYDLKTRYALSHVVYHLTKASRVVDALSCYLTVSKLMRICDAARLDRDVGRVIEEAEVLMELVQVDSTKLQYCSSVLRLASRALAIDARMLPAQILGRLGYPPYDNDQTHFERQAEDWLLENRRQGGPHVARPIQNWLSGLDFAGGSLERTWHLHNRVSGVAFGRKGEVCVTIGNEVQLFERHTGRMLQEFSGHSNRVTGVAISSDSKWIVAGSVDGTARLWNLESGKEEQLFVGHTDEVTSVAISNDSKWVVTGSGSEDTTARLWNLKSGEAERVLCLHSKEITSVGISIDSKWVVTGSCDKTARLWNLESGKEERVFRGHSLRVTSVAISNDSKWILTGSFDKTARLWNLESGKEERVVRGHSLGVTSVAISSDAKWIVTCSRDTTARLWNLQSGNEERAFSGHSNSVGSVAISNDSKWMVTGSDDRTARLWNLKSGKKERALRGHSNGENSHAIFDVSSRNVTNVSDNARFGNLESGKDKRMFSEHSGFVTSVAISDDSKWIVTGPGDETARLWNLQSGKEIRVLRGHSDKVTSVAISNDSKWIVTGSFDKTARLWDLQSGKCERTFFGYSNMVKSAAISKDSKWIVAVSDFGLIENSGMVTSVAISNDSQWIVTGSGDKTARLWNLASGKEERVFNGHSDAVTCVAISNDSNWIVTASSDNTARLWSLDRGTEERMINGHASEINSVAISNDSKWIMIHLHEGGPIICDLLTGESDTYSNVLPPGKYPIPAPRENEHVSGKDHQAVGFVLDFQVAIAWLQRFGDLVYSVHKSQDGPVCWTLDKDVLAFISDAGDEISAGEKRHTRPPRKMFRQIVKRFVVVLAGVLIFWMGMLLSESRTMHAVNSYLNGYKVTRVSMTYPIPYGFTFCPNQFGDIQNTGKQYVSCEWWKIINQDRELNPALTEDP